MIEALRFDGAVLVRSARKDGRAIAILRLVRGETGCTVEAKVYPRSAGLEVRPGPYRFSTLAEATAFMDEALDALGYLGCEVD